ncbi:MAG: carboxylate--amine ligase [Actinomycetaceae bacterium]|nr:carboxylate--amine ligase [Actinomycetaceae bacterium]
MQEVHGPDIRPVILGADIGVYALARAFFEAFGVNSTVISSFATGPIAHSSICEVHAAGRVMLPNEYVQRAIEFADAWQGPGQLVLLANTDSLIRAIAERVDELRTRYLLQVLPMETLDLVSDKASFARLCAEVGVPHPQTVVVDCSGIADGAWKAPDVPFAFPVVAKAAKSSDYEGLSFEGKKKVYLISTPDELQELWSTLALAGFRSTFVVQEVIPGDDTQVWSVTAYVNTQGIITLKAAAHVLLEDHAPSALGNPVAMVTNLRQDLLDYSTKLLERSGYRGFANFDVKVDPRNGTPYFLEVNPRIGRNNYYATASGANPASAMMEDLLLDVGASSPHIHLGDKEILYLVVPLPLLARYIGGEEKANILRLHKNAAIVHPLRNAQDRAWKRRMYVAQSQLNHVYKFLRYYPKPTDTAF